MAFIKICAILSNSFLELLVYISQPTGYIFLLFPLYVYKIMQLSFWFRKTTWIYIVLRNLIFPNAENRLNK